MNQLFVNQQAALSACAKAIRARRARVVAVRGDAGVGKSWLLSMAARDAVSWRRRVVFLDLAYLGDGSAFLVSLASQLREQGVAVPNTDIVLDALQDVARLQASISESAPGGGSDDKSVAARGWPDPRGQERAVILARTVGATAGRAQSDPEQALREAWVGDARKAFRRRRLVLFVDGKDRDVQRDAWLARFVADLPENSAMLFATHEAPGQAWGAMNVDVIEMAPLKHAARMELVRRLAKVEYGRNATHSEVELALKAAAPDALSLAVAADNVVGRSVRSAEQLAASVPSQAASIMLAHERPEILQAFKRLSATRWFDRELVSDLCATTPDESAMICNRPAVFPASTGFQLHDSVRHALYGEWLSSDPDGVRATHSACASSLLERIEGSGGRSLIAGDELRRAIREYCYHALKADLPVGKRQTGLFIHRSLDKGDPALVESILKDASESASASDAWLCAWHSELAYARGAWDESLQSIELAISGGPVFASEIAPLLIVRARIAYHRGQFADALADLTRARDLFLRSDGVASSDLGYVVEQIAKVFRMRGEMSQAIDQHRAAVKICRASGDTYSLASALGSFGTTLLLAGDQTASVAQLTESIQLAREKLHSVFLNTGLRSRSMALAQGWMIEESLEDSHECAQLSQSRGDSYNASVAHVYMAEGYLARLEVDTAFELIDAAISTLTALDARADLVNALACRGLARALKGDITTALEDLSQGFQIAESHDFRYGCARLALRTSDVLRIGGEYSGCDEYLKQCVSISRKSGFGYLACRSGVDLQLVSGLSVSPGIRESAMSNVDTSLAASIADVATAIRDGGELDDPANLGVLARVFGERAKWQAYLRADALSRLSYVARVGGVGPETLCDWLLALGVSLDSERVREPWRATTPVSA